MTSSSFPQTHGLLDFPRPDGSPCPGYFAPAGAERPSVIVLQEWWGLNAQIRGVADRFAAAGFNALAPDLYRGRVTQNPDEASHMMDGLDFFGATDQDVAGAVNFLRRQSTGKVAVMGFCMGGALTISAAVRVAGLAAAVCFYGIPPRTVADPAQIAIPFQGHFANQDTWCTPAAADGLAADLSASSAPVALYRYDAAHGFFNHTRPAYDEAAADLAWQRTIDFLRGV